LLEENWSGYRGKRLPVGRVTNDFPRFRANLIAQEAAELVIPMFRQKKGCLFVCFFYCSKLLFAREAFALVKGPLYYF